MNKFTFKKTPIKNLKLVKKEPIKDKRGFFNRLYCYDKFEKVMGGKIVRQINMSFTIKKGTVRGLHFQKKPCLETKIVYCLRGEVWDVVVDLRKGSPTFLHYHSEILNRDNNKSCLIPDGFAHGFQTLTSDCEMLYLHTADYNKNFEGAINVVDPKIGINWPLRITELSERDGNIPFLPDNFKGLEL